jgi:hypothetical protein
MTDATNGTSLYDLFETSSDVEMAGAWIPVGPARFKLARAGGGNENFLKTAQKRLKPFQSSLESLPKQVADEIAIGIFVDTILMDWEGVTDRSGAALPFSKDAAKKLLSDLPNLFAVLREEAGKLSNFNKTALEDAAKN